ncbi:hypothetical protein [Polyangium sorediatum]|uniref:Lipoprotein n=1 Tax=Polyangium sorediatum TaxID=889274 RepID=A0ABT6P458_9BACT|nr:hypothetical protein [Polyangium sorediatum]MDI1435331.1 hypothetical protein [Polyangium sorediatum]
MRRLWVVLFASTLFGCSLIPSKTSGLLGKTPGATKTAEQDPSSQGSAGVKNLSERAEKVTAKAAKGEAITAEWHNRLTNREAFVAYVTKSYQEPAAKVEVTIEPSWFEGFTPLDAKYKAAIDEASKTNRWDHAAKIDDKATTDYFRGFHSGKDGTVDAKVLEVAAYDDWSVTKELGLPVSRDRRVQVMIQAKGETYCRVYGVTVNSKYNGGWGAPYTIGGANIQSSSCK